MKNRLTMTLALILCFASMTFAGSSSRGSKTVDRPTVQPILETDTGIVAVVPDNMDIVIFQTMGDFFRFMH